MSDNYHGEGEVADALANIYTESQMRKVFGTVRWRSDIQRAELEMRVQNAVEWYGPYHRVLEDEVSPSIRERRLQNVLSKLRGAVAAVRELPTSELDHLQTAGQDVAKADGKLPDVQPEPVELPPRPGQSEPEFMNVWHADLQIEASLEQLDWLIRSVERAIERARQEKDSHGGRRADDALHMTIRLLDKVYRECAADPRTPGADIGDGSADSRTWRKGELLDFLEAALRPLGIQKNREAVYADWRRATEVLPEHNRLVRRQKAKGKKRGRRSPT